MGAEPEASGSDDPSEAQPAESNGYAAFQKTWNVGDGTSRADNSEEPEDDGGDNGVDGGDNGDDDGDDDEDDDGEEFTNEEGEGSEDNMVVEEQEITHGYGSSRHLPGTSARSPFPSTPSTPTPSTSQQTIPALSQISSSRLSASSLPTSSRSTPSLPASISHRSHSSSQSRRIDKLLRSAPRDALTPTLQKHIQQLQEELRLVRSERNAAQMHAIFTYSEIEDLKQKANGKGKKKNRKVKINAKLVTSREAWARHDAERLE